MLLELYEMERELQQGQGRFCRNKQMAEWRKAHPDHGSFRHALGRLLIRTGEMLQGRRSDRTRIAPVPPARFSHS